MNWPSPPLPDGPLMIGTGLVRPIKVTITKGLTQPWSMVFVLESAGDFTVLVAERGGTLRKIRNGVLDPSPVAGLPADIQAAGLAGLMDIQLHPKFADNKFVYLTYHKRQAGVAPAAPPANPPAGRGGRGPAPPPGVVTLARGRWDGSKLVDVTDIFTGQPSGNASRILFARDGTLIMTLGYGDPPQAKQGNPDPDKMPPQDPMNLAGKTLRLKDDGTVPPDNPFVGKARYPPEIYTLGHRNILGLAMNPETGAIWSVENGPNGGDEVNELMPGKTTAGQSSTPDASIWVRASASIRTGPTWSRQSRPGYRRLRHRAWSSTRATSSTVEEQPVRRRHAAGRSATLRTPRTLRLQREVGGTAPRRDVARLAAAHPRRAAGARWQSLSAHRGERRCADAHRTRQVGAFMRRGLTPSQFFTHSGGQRCASFYLRLSSL